MGGKKLCINQNVNDVTGNVRLSIFISFQSKTKTTQNLSPLKFGQGCKWFPKTRGRGQVVMQVVMQGGAFYSAKKWGVGVISWRFSWEHL